VIFRLRVAVEPWTIAGVRPGRRGLENDSGWWQGEGHLMDQGEEIPAELVRYRSSLLINLM
jgi:hypothetical protein